MQLIIHTDGGARGNPGPAAIGVVMETDDTSHGLSNTTEIAGFGKKIGETTNNVAEYTAVIEALQYVRDSIMTKEKNVSVSSIQFVLDSLLVVNQLNGLFKVKEPHLRELLFSVRSLEQELKMPITYQAVRREHNRRADFFVNQALDA